VSIDAANCRSGAIPAKCIVFFNRFPRILPPYMDNHLLPTMIRIIEEKAKYNSTSIFPDPFAAGRRF